MFGVGESPNKQTKKQQQQMMIDVLGMMLRQRNKMPRDREWERKDTNKKRTTSTWMFEPNKMGSPLISEGEEEGLLIELVTKLELTL